MKHLTANNFSKEVAGHKGVVVVDFYAEWCGPCKVLGPLFEELDKENKNKQVTFAKVNVDNEHALAHNYSVMSIPTVIIFKDGKVVDQKVGVASKQDYQNAIKEAVEYTPGGPKKVIVFSTPTCPYCHMAKEYLKQKGIIFKDVDVSQDEQSAITMVQKSGQMGVPQLWIGNQVVVGFDKKQIDTLLES